MIRLHKDDTVKIDSPTGSWGIIIKESLTTGLVDVKWYYGKDVKGDYMTAVSYSVSPYSLVKVNPTEFWRRANRIGFDGELGAPIKDSTVVRTEIILWYDGVPKISGKYLVKHKGSSPVEVRWDAENKEYTSLDGELLTFLNDGIIYFTTLPEGP